MPRRSGAFRGSVADRSRLEERERARPRAAARQDELRRGGARGRIDERISPSGGWLVAGRCRLSNHWNVIEIPSVKLEPRPTWSRNQAWKLQVCPALVDTVPAPWGIAVRSTGNWN